MLFDTIIKESAQVALSLRNLHSAVSKQLTEENIRNSWLIADCDFMRHII